MSAEAFTEPVLSILRSAKGPEAAEYERIWKDYAAGNIDLTGLNAQTNRVRAAVLVREGPHKRPFPRNPRVDAYCQMRVAIAQGSTFDKGAHLSASRGREEYERWYLEVADAFDVRAELIVALWRGGDRQDTDAYNALLGQGDQMQSFYRGLSVPWWPKHSGDEFQNVMAAWGELRSKFSPLRGWA